MRAHLLRSLSDGRVRGARVDVDFKLSGRSLDNSLGRAAHLQYLLDQNFIERLLCTYRHHFEPPAETAD